MGVYSNELECVAFASSRNFTRNQPLERGPGTPFFNFSTQALPCACRVYVSISVANGQKTSLPNANTHTHTRIQFELYILDHCIVSSVCMVLAQLQLLDRVLASHAKVQRLAMSSELPSLPSTYVYVFRADRYTSNTGYTCSRYHTLHLHVHFQYRLIYINKLRNNK